MLKNETVSGFILEAFESIGKINALIAKVESLESEMMALKAMIEPSESGQPITIPHAALVKQIGRDMVRKGEASGALNPICRNGGKGPKKMYLLTEIKALMSFYEKEKRGANG